MINASKNKVVFDNEQVSISQFRCWPDCELWKRENCVGRRAELAFPRRAVAIHQNFKHRAAASPNEVMLYDAHNLYTRQPIDPRGDLCEVFAVEPCIMEDIVSHTHLRSTKSTNRFFTDAFAPCRSSLYLWQRSLFLHVRAVANPDPVFVEESVYSIIHRALSDAAQFYQKRTAAAKKKTSLRNRKLAEDAAEFIAHHHQLPITLKQIAENCGCSVYHLCHVFQANKGVSLYQYLLRYRLRSSVAEVRDETPRKRLLNRVATDYCFASHSHFTSSFFKQFGFTPSQFRDWKTEAILEQIEPTSQSR